MKGGGPAVGIILSQETEHSRVKVLGVCGKIKTYQFNDLITVTSNCPAYEDFVTALEYEESKQEERDRLQKLTTKLQQDASTKQRGEQLRSIRKVVEEVSTSSMHRIEMSLADSFTKATTEATTTLLSAIRELVPAKQERSIRPMDDSNTRRSRKESRSRSRSTDRTHTRRSKRDSSRSRSGSRHSRKESRSRSRSTDRTHTRRSKRDSSRSRSGSRHSRKESRSRSRSTDRTHSRHSKGNQKRSSSRGSSTDRVRSKKKKTRR
jgi:hypothetical protein